MKRIYIPTLGVSSWQERLAEPNQWRTGYSAKSIAHDWEEAEGIPAELSNSLYKAFGLEPELIAAFPEHKVDLPGGRRSSQNDVLAFVGLGLETLILAVEGKVRETFGPIIAEWLPDPNDSSPAAARSGKRPRLDFIAKLLGLSGEIDPTLRYQLFHRTASAILEARRFRADHAGMLVHSYAEDRRWFEDFARFAELFGRTAEPGRIEKVLLPDGLPLHLGWVTGNQAMLQR